jgi:hypothetical protein
MGFPYSKVIDAAGGTVEASDGSFHILVRFPAGTFRDPTTVVLRSPEDAHASSGRDSGSKYYRVTCDKALVADKFYDVYVKLIAAPSASWKVYTTNVVSDNDPGVWLPSPQRFDGVGGPDMIGGTFCNVLGAFQLMKAR